MIHRHRYGITAIQLLVILGLLLFLGALLLPAVSKVREAASRTQSMNNLKLLGLSMHNYNEVHKKLPPIAGKVGAAEGSVLFFLLPYLEQDKLYKSAFQNGEKANSWNIAGAVVPMFIDPQDSSAPHHRFQNAIATTSYAGNWHVFKDGASDIRATFQDGTANTLAFTTRYQICNITPTAWAYSDIYTWTPMFAYYNFEKFQVAPLQDHCDPRLSQSFSWGTVIALGDGSVRSVSREISARTWHAIITPAGGEILGADF